MSISPPFEDSVVVQPVIVTIVTKSLPLLAFVTFSNVFVFVFDASPLISTDFSVDPVFAIISPWPLPFAFKNNRSIS